ncbi:hypothetical protein PBI_SCTP2_318 [Salicola phage SCTP-2]|nr:hypothetical protein PBI_SCTP2_318 [Salicola phage SCTP-2]
MILYFYDSEGKLRAIEGDLDITDQKQVKEDIKKQTGIKVKSSVLKIVNNKG